MRTRRLASVAILIGVVTSVAAPAARDHAGQEADAALRERARTSLRKAVEFYRTKVATEGGYHFAYAEDLSYGRSEMSEGPTRVEVQREGTPLVGIAYLEAYAATADAYYLDAARDVARALVKGQSCSGGWDGQRGCREFAEQRLPLFQIETNVTSMNGYVHDSSKKQGWCLEQMTLSLAPADVANFQFVPPSQPETYQETEQVTKGVSYQFSGTVGFSKDGASASASAGLTYSNGVTYGEPDVAYVNQSSGGLFQVQVNVRGPQMDKELFTGGLRGPAKSGVSSFQPTFGVILWANSSTRAANTISQSFTLTMALVYVYRWATSTTSSDTRQATCSQQISFTVAYPPEVQAV